MGMPPSAVPRVARTIAPIPALVVLLLVLSGCTSTTSGSGSTSSRPSSGSASTPTDGATTSATGAVTTPASTPAATSATTPGPSGPSGSTSTAWRTELVVPTNKTTAPPPTSGDEPTGIDPALTPYVTLAKADLARRLGVPPDQVEARILVVAATITTWPDASMGCPKPGQSYPPKPVDGSVIVLTVDGQDYAYHSGDATPPFLCQP